MSAKNILIGIDFDNTIACYDDIFHQIASERGLIPSGTPRNKESVRDYLRKAGKEDIWTEMQGYVYGARMSDVPAFPGVFDCIAKLRAKGIPVFIISHKTRHPYKGGAYDLHKAARRWLEANGISNIGIYSKDVFLEETKEGKLSRIHACGCTHFIDDLPEFLAEPAFPKKTKKLLFSPARMEGASLGKDVKPFKSWREITEFLLSQYDDELKTKIAALLPGADILRIGRLPASGNNRLYLVDSGEKKFVAKHYFTHAEDRRGRLISEFSFASFAVKHGIDCLPSPIARDEKNNIALYSFIKGVKPDRPDVTKSAVVAALDFLIEINRYRDKAGKDLPDAAESCFSINAHIDMVEKRVNRLSMVTDPDAARFIKKELVPAWGNIKKAVLSEVRSKGTRADEDLRQCDRIISPSDFGFHNSIIGEDGRFNFLDFEYAGWDDPAKTVGDFFSHLALPVPLENFGMFAKGVAGLTSDPSLIFSRICLLLQLYRIKWCCIALNHFVPIDSGRRRFAGNDVDRDKEAQLTKAVNLLDSMQKLNGARSGLY